MIRQSTPMMPNAVLKYNAHELWGKLSRLLPLLALDCKDLLCLYFALGRSLSDDEKKSFKVVLGKMMNRKVFSFRDRVVPDTVRVLERILSIGIRFKFFLDIREGFFMPLFSPLPLAVKYVGINKDRAVLYRDASACNMYRDPLPEHYSVRLEYHLHWLLQRGYKHVAMAVCDEYPSEKIDFTYKCRGYSIWDFVNALPGGHCGNQDLVHKLEMAITRKAIELGEKDLVYI